MNNQRIVFISGPAHHSDQIYRALSGRYDITYFKYYPKFLKQTRNQRSTSLFFNALSYLVWGVFNKLKWDKRRAKRIVFGLYDKLCSKAINQSTDLLIAWPQVSLMSIKKANALGVPVLLEYPMIHPLQWNKILNQEYDRLKIPPHQRKTLFDDSQLDSMLSEIKYSDHINVLSEFAKASFIEESLPSDQIHKTLPGINTGVVSGPPKAKTPSSPFIVMFVGRIDVLKGVHYLLRAFAGLEIKRKELWLVGSVNPEIERLLNKYKNLEIKLFGFQPHQSLMALYSKANAVVLPSVQESFGLVILEALSQHVPVIANNNTGAPDIASHTKGVYLYEYNDCKQLQNHLMNVSEHQIRTGTLNPYFSEKEYGRRYLNLIDDVFNQKSR